MFLLRASSKRLARSRRDWLWKVSVSTWSCSDGKRGVRPGPPRTLQPGSCGEAPGKARGVEVTRAPTGAAPLPTPRASTAFSAGSVSVPSHFYPAPGLAGP